MVTNQLAVPPIVCQIGTSGKCNKGYEGREGLRAAYRRMVSLFSHGACLVVCSTLLLHYVVCKHVLFY